MPMFDFIKENTHMDTENVVAANESPAEPDLATKVQMLIDEIRPFLQEDGGDCELLKVEDNVVYVRLVGACVGCPSSLVTLKHGVENRIKEAIPEIESVEMV